VNQQDLIIHYPFDDVRNNWTDNHGAFSDRYYHGEVLNGGTVPGLLNRALKLSHGGHVISAGWNPFEEGDSRTVSVWLKTDSRETLGVTGTVHDWHRQGRKSELTVFSLVLEDGMPVIRNGDDIRISVTEGDRLHDGAWHHVAYVVPHDGARLSDVRVYVDGEKRETAVSHPAALIEWDKYGIAVGMTCRRGEPKRFFDGALDDFGVWVCPLPEAQIRALYGLAADPDLRMNASEVEQLFDLYRTGHGQVRVGKSRWQYARDLKGGPGTVLKSDGQCAVVLDGSGNGVVTAEYAD
jgi:hypothetical protein